ncbi:MAG: GNAT family N-acetyltransferase [Actinophytocola sp.]|uniref:bifunctional acetate--CoA ligase family protein/GNAT family N-acetyltransferase n=1 Tax=Actinophytocola sp. TaxID=1872138 RepID=UPI0013277DE1|nr:bifunctional GNAT family N-acetyltransferase/acetate--CoA ligase family protein [Actinophytocola sp.]MPZ78974.1 GNAT family N-acetyltransferase [Actinophytocola sp.]
MSAAISPNGVRALLADGRVVMVRTITSADADAVLSLHMRLSEHDRYLRFFGTGTRVLDAITRRIARTANGTHAAVGAWLGEQLVGVANYEAMLGATTAEVALVVDGTVQARGLGTLLLEHLASMARHHGITRFVAEVLAENRRMIQVFADTGLPYRMSTLEPERHVEISLTADERFAAAVDERDRVADVASLANILRPKGIVVVGAGRRPGSVGHAVLRNLIDGGFTGRLTAVNPHADEIAGVPCRPSVAELTEIPDLAVVCVPAASVPDAVEECGREGIPAVVVISAGLSGTNLATHVLASVRRHGMRLVGPNCVGVVNTDPAAHMNATFTRGDVPEGGVGIVTQSGGVGIALVELLRQLGLGVSTMVSTGDKYDVSGNDMLLWWRQDPNTAAVVLYLESFGNPRKFSRLARGLARTKPIIAVRSAESDVVQRAAASHTAAAATPAVTRDALFEQAGVIAVDTVSEVTDVLAALAWQPLPAGNRVAILSNAGGAGVLAADACVHNGLVVPRLSQMTQVALAELLPAQASLGNPIDTTAGVDAATFGACLEVLLADDDIDAVLAAGVPTALADPVTATATLAMKRRKTVLMARPGQLASVTGFGDGTGPATASFADPAAAAAALGRVAAYARWRRQPVGTATEPVDIQLGEAWTLVRDFLRAEPDGGWLAPDTAMRLLDLFGIPAVRSIMAADADSAVTALRELGGPVAVKVVAAGVLHKARAGGVTLNVATEEELRATVAAFRDRFGDAVQGVLLQPMAMPGRELIVGVDSDDTFGPLVLFGLGGTDTDLIADRVARLTPLCDVDAERMVHGLRSSTALFGGDHPLPTEGIVDVLTRISRLAETIPEVAELDLNPVIVRQHGCQVLDARVRLVPREPADPFLRRLRA